MKNILKTTACAVICALFLTACPDKKDSLSVTPNNLEFEATGTAAQLVKVTTSAKSWDVNTTDGWLKVEKVDNGFNVTAVDYASYDNDRNGTITVNAGNADPATVTVTQKKLVAPPLPVLSNYTATGTPVWLTNPGPSTWTGQVIPSTGTDQFYTITNFGGTGIKVYLDIKDGKLVIDNYTMVAGNDTYEGYFKAMAYDASTDKGSILSNDYVVAYDRTTRIMDFSGTSNGLPVAVGVLAKNKSTGAWGAAFTDMYKNLKLQLTPVSQSSSSSSASTVSAMKAGVFSSKESVSAESFKSFRIVK